MSAAHMIAGDTPRHMDIYFVQCPGSAPAESRIYMGIYHKGFVEPRPVP